jgi:hypothetical protein
MLAIRYLGFARSKAGAQSLIVAGAEVNGGRRSENMLYFQA